MKILVICPTIYPDKFENMYNSYQVTSSKNSKLLIINKKGGVTNLINEAFNKHNDYDFYFVINDDIVFETPLWDLELAKFHRITHGDDSIKDGIAGQFLMIPGDFARALGWLQMPLLNRYCGDAVWRFIGQQLNCLDYHKNVVITHNWENCAEPLVNQIDMESFSEWLPRSHKDVNKIMEVINGGK